MSTVIELSDQELAELKELTNEGDAALAVRRAMTEFLRFGRRMRLKQMSGQVHMDENWQSLEDAEVRNQNDEPRDGAG